jgi:hypothetical protein
VSNLSASWAIVQWPDFNTAMIWNSLISLPWGRMLSVFFSVFFFGVTFFIAEN